MDGRPVPEAALNRLGLSLVILPSGGRAAISGLHVHPLALAMPLALALACTAPRAARPPAPTAGASAACTIMPPPATLPESLTIAVTDSVNPSHAPRPVNEAERVVFSQLYEPPLHLACDDTTALDPDSAAVARRALADPARAPVQPIPGSPWPAGTGRYVVAASDRNTLRLVPRPGLRIPVLLVRLLDPHAARDALDAGADVVITADPAAIAYARERADHLIVPLQFDRSYVLTVPAGAVTARTAAAPDSLAALLRTGLAAGAVREDARPSDGPHWWTDAAFCGAAAVTTPAPAPPSTDRIVFPDGDPVARALADRIVALAATGSPLLAAAAPRLSRSTSFRAAALAGGDFAAALDAGEAAAFVLALPARVADRCAERRLLDRRAPWLARPDGAQPPLVPLVDTREHVIVRRGAVGITTDWLGALTFDGPAAGAP